MASRFDFLLRTSLEGDREAIARLGRLTQALDSAAKSAQKGTAQHVALANAHTRAASTLERARGTFVASSAIDQMGFGPVQMPGGSGPGGGGRAWRSYVPGGGKGGGGGFGPPGGGNVPLAGGDTGGGAFGRYLAESRLGNRAGRFFLGGGIPLHVKAYLGGLLAMRTAQGVAGLAQSAGQLAATKGTYNELSGGAAAGDARTAAISAQLGGILSQQKIRQGVAGLVTSGAKGLDGKALSNETLATLMKGVTQLGRNAGFDSTTSLNRLQSAVSTGSTAGLDKILPGFDADLAVRKFMDETGMEKDEVESTPGLQQSIVTQAILDAIKVGNKNTPEASREAGDQFDRLSAAAEDAKNGLVETVGSSREFRAGVDGMTQALKAATPGVANFLGGAVKELGSVRGMLAVSGIAGAAKGAQAGFALAGPGGALAGAGIGIMPAMYAAGREAADSGAAAIRAVSGETARGRNFAEAPGFDQAAYDKEQAAFQQKLAAMTDAEYTAFRGSAEYKGIENRNADESATLASGAGEKLAEVFWGLAEAVVEVQRNMRLFGVVRSPVGVAVDAVSNVAGNVG